MKKITNNDCIIINNKSNVLLTRKEVIKDAADGMYIPNDGQFCPILKIAGCAFYYNKFSSADKLKKCNLRDKIYGKDFPKSFDLYYSNARNVKITIQSFKEKIKK